MNLFECISNYDFHGISKCLADGIEPDTVNECEEDYLTFLITNHYEQSTVLLLAQKLINAGVNTDNCFNCIKIKLENEELLPEIREKFNKLLTLQNHSNDKKIISDKKFELNLKHKEKCKRSIYNDIELNMLQNYAKSLGLSADNTNMLSTRIIDRILKLCNTSINQLSNKY